MLPELRVGSWLEMMGGLFKAIALAAGYDTGSIGSVVTVDRDNDVH